MSDEPKENVSVLVVVLGTAGLLLCSSGTLLQEQTSQSLAFTSGSFLLFLSAWKDSNLFFSLLSLLAVVGAATGLFELSDEVRVILPLLVGCLLFCVLLLKKQLTSFLQWYGALGLLLVALGYAVLHPVVYLVGGVILCTFATIEFCKGVKIALLWAVLNFIFSIAACFRIFGGNFV